MNKEEILTTLLILAFILFGLVWTAQGQIILPTDPTVPLKHAVGYIGGTQGAEKPIDLDRYSNAIFKSEGSYSATYLYGIRSVNYKDEAEARDICKRTVYNTLVKYRSTRCQEGESDLDCLARRYCPINSDTDNGTCQYWKKNVLWFLENPKEIQ